MRLYRVTGFNGETKEEFHLGFFVALSREGAIMVARNRLNRGLVLDAVEIKKLSAREELLFANAPWPKKTDCPTPDCQFCAPKPVAEFAEELADAYSTDNYGGDWGPCIKALRHEFSLDDKQIEAVIRSKWTRWAADSASRPYGRANSRGLVKFMKTLGGAPLMEQVKRLTQESGL